MPEGHTEAPAFTLRDARPDEASAIGALLQAAYAQYEPNYTLEGWQRYYGMLGEVGSHFEHAEVIVAERDGELAGAVMFYADGSKSEQGDWPPGWAGILRLAVHPNYRGRGLARILTEECVRRCRTAGIPTIALHATEWMAVSRGMYERMGFVRDESFDFHTRSGVLAMGYRLDLS
jgi:ribosomal protein S18 acetylase RimI-like enzyme